ncbi:MAG: DUF4271 domain-containing protein [Lutibacter sp.]|jgi:hypothetical protein|nr:DUF4271 domain-containing protein [Lutibacter sp.]
MAKILQIITNFVLILVGIAMFEASNIIRENNDLITGVFSLTLIILAALKVLFGARLSANCTHFLPQNYLSTYNLERNSTFNLFQGLMFLLQLLVLSAFSLLTGLVLGYPVIHPEPAFSMLFFLLVLMGYLGIRYLVGFLLSVVFDLRKLHEKIVYEKMNYRNNLILWILPMVVPAFYIKSSQEFLVKMTVSVLLTLYLFRYALLVSNNKKVIVNNLFYFILYLCALEVAPLMIILKLTL